MRTRVKICGFTRIDDAVSAAGMGVDAIGLVFYPASPRHVDLERAAAISRSLPAFVSVVALFVDAEASLIQQVLNSVRVDCLQFHGNEPADVCRAYNKPYIKAIQMQPHTKVAELEKQYHDACGLLLDAYHPGLQGGTGNGFDWDLIPGNCRLPIILAGGLTADNAGQAIRTVKPYALDVSSGVETAKGIKDAEKMAAFIKITNQAIEI